MRIPSRLQPSSRHPSNLCAPGLSNSAKLNKQQRQQGGRTNILDILQNTRIALDTPVVDVWRCKHVLLYDNIHGVGKPSDIQPGQADHSPLSARLMHRGARSLAFTVAFSCCSRCAVVHFAHPLYDHLRCDDAGLSYARRGPLRFEFRNPPPA